MVTDGASPAVEVSRRIHAPPAVIFRVLADPEMHVAMDGSGMLRGAETKEIVTGVGDVFIMNMHFRALGDYQMDNHVVEFEPNVCIGWEPVAGVGHPGVGEKMGHRWCFRLSPDGTDGTIVTEVYDCSKAPREFREEMHNGTIWIPSMHDTLERLADVVSRR